MQLNNLQKFVLYGILSTIVVSIGVGVVYADGISNLLRDTGFVGIGTITPTAELEVIGDVKMSGSLISDGDICIGNCADTTPPIITLTGNNPQTIELGDGYTELGATTNDGSSVTIDSTAFTDAVGTYSVLYDSTDDVGNQAVQVTRTVNVVSTPPADTTPPIITLTGNNPQTIELGDGYTELGATTNDGSSVTIDSTAFTDAVGTYSVLYDSTDDVGNQAVQVTRTVNVVSTPPADTTLIYDTFDDTTENWQYFGVSGYSMSHSTEHGGSIHLSGNSFAHPYTNQGLEKTVDISGVSDSLVLSLDYRAKSNFAGSAVTNTVLAVHDGATDELLYSNKLAWGVGTQDIGWKSFEQDILSQVQGHDSITIKLFIVDAWNANWNQQNWYDNIKLE